MRSDLFCRLASVINESYGWIRVGEKKAYAIHSVRIKCQIYPIVSRTLVLRAAFSHSQYPKGSIWKIAEHDLDKAIRLIAEHAFYSVLADVTETDTAPLLSFFHEDLADDWQSILEAAKVLAELTLNGRSSALDYESKSTQAQFRALCSSFKAVLAQGLACSKDSASEHIGKKPSKSIV